ncbi:MAG: glycerol kinase GlpK [Gulosibacter sp.]|uniref:glycerol kinase GlpK n=1 Tax=Gulosibacter sp. TaxID=2817531 RepID=UPI003F8E3FDB
MSKYVLALDNGTTSTRAIVFDETGSPIATSQREHRQIFPRQGWVEHDPVEIWTNAEWAIASVIAKAGLMPQDISAIGLTNQRETVFVWDRHSGRPVYNAIVWQDTRTLPQLNEISPEQAETISALTGLPVATYFSASKIAWILDQVPGARTAAARGDLLFGTADSWLVWNLTGGSRGGIHITDVTNASRTLLLDIETLEWSSDLLDIWDIPRVMLPEVRSSSEIFGSAHLRSIEGVPIAGILGDQQAAAFGQAAFESGESKNTYGTGNFLLVNTGTELVRSTHGLISTVAYRCGDEPARYALEGSIAVTGSLVQWLRDNLGLIERSEEIEELALSVADNGGTYLVPAFSGLYAPYWRPDARGALVGLTSFVNRGHIARAALESTAFQTRDVMSAMTADTALAPTLLRVDGGMTRNNLLMQFQADILGVSVVRPRVIETTALGAAYAAGLATDVWRDREELRTHARIDRKFEPSMTRDERDARLARWARAVEKSLDWSD